MNRKSVQYLVILLALGLGFIIGHFMVVPEPPAPEKEMVQNSSTSGLTSIISLPSYGIVSFPGSVTDEVMLKRIQFQALLALGRGEYPYTIIEGKQCLLTPFGTDITVSNIKKPCIYDGSSLYTTVEVEKDGTVVVKNK